jgi:hypothetical protein
MFTGVIILIAITVLALFTRYYHMLVLMNYEKHKHGERQPHDVFTDILLLKSEEEVSK